MMALVLQCPAKHIYAFLEAQAERYKLGLWDKYYLVTDYRGKLDLKDFHIKRLDKDYGFSGNLIRLMPEIEEDMFFFSPEDHRPLEVDVEAVKRAFENMIADTDIGMLRLFYFDRYPLIDKTKFMSSLKPRDVCYISLGGMGIWCKDYFQTFLREGRTAKDFERMGTIKASGDNKVFGTNTTVYKHFNILMGGKRTNLNRIKKFQ